MVQCSTITNGPAQGVPVPTTPHLELRCVSVIAPCRNERAHVLGFCDAVAAQRLPTGLQLEVLVADGDSSDGTRELLLARCAEDPRFVLVDNPRRIVSTGLNACLARARGEVIVRMDIHTDYDPHYISECLAALARTGADNVGGPWRAEATGRTQRAIAASFQSRWVAGGARSRELDYEGPADTVYLGCWPRATFERFGGFDEQLVRNQDDEHNLRLCLGGATVWQSARIVSRYRPRASLAQLFRQQRQYGYWKPFVMRRHQQPAALRQLVPGAFVGMLGLALLLSVLLPGAWPGLLALLALYGGYLLVVSVLIAHEAGWSLLPVLPWAIAATHVGYGLGTWRGWWDVLLRGRPSPGFGVLTR